jgi:uncharacterized protein (TIGR03083 family)
MESARLLDSLASDFDRLRKVATTADLAAPVPSCPGWTLADLIRHVGTVYLHKVECLRLGSHPEDWPPAGLADEDPAALLDRSYAALTAEFGSRDPADPAFTWYGPDQTVGFWIRRMAQETVIHRVDAELAAEVEPGAIPDDIALDGIDEFLIAFIEYGSRTWPDEYGDTLGTADGRSVRLDTTGGSWLVRATPEEVQVRVSDLDGAEAGVTADPPTLLLWLWNRAGDDEVAVTGEADAVAYLRTVFAAGAQ